MALTLPQSTAPIAKTMTGARALIHIRQNLVGLATECNWSVRIGQESVHTLGRYEPQEIVTTAQEAVEVTVNGLRIVDSGPHVGATGGKNAAIVPTLADLIDNKDMTIEILDRQSNKTIMSVVGCRSLGYSSTVNSKGMMSLSMNFVGIKANDETVKDSENSDESASTYDLG